MRTIAVANQKGGCGKTTIVINLAACLAREGQRTLAVDLDPQAHCALGLLVPEEQVETNIADVLLAETGDGPVDLSRVIWQISSHFDLIPSKIDLSKLEQKLAGVPGREHRLGRILDSIRDRYDFVLIDTPPTVGFLTQSALAAADEIIVPVDTGYFSLHGLQKQLDTIRELRAETGRTLSVRIVANLYDVRTKLAREILAELRRRHGDALFTSFINFNTKLKESTSLGQPITEYDPASSGCRDFVRFARELIAVGSGRAVPTEASAEAEAEASRVEDEEVPVSRSLERAAVTRGMPGAVVEPAQQAVEVRQEVGGRQALLDRAEALAASASKLLATTETLIGPGRASRSAETPAASRRETVDARATDAKIELIYGPRAVEHGVVFVVAAAGARNVRLAGDFNGWNPERTPMSPLRDGAFFAQLPLGPGSYRYRYVIDGQWLRDPANPRMEQNPYGDMNSVLELV